MDVLLAGVEAKIAEADESRLFWLRSRPTWLRRAIGSLAAVLVIVVGGVLVLRGDFATYPPLFMALAIGALGVLLGLSVHHALRPIHRPPLPRWARIALITLTLGATFALAILSPNDLADPPTGGLFAHVSPCLFYGLLFGAPVYLVLRVLHRGSDGSTLLAACAAGLAANLVLQLHCQHNHPEHLMLGHASVAVLFVGAIGIVHAATRR